MSKTNTRVVEVHVSGLSPSKWEKLSVTLAARKGIEFVSAVTGRFYVRSRTVAARLTKSIRDRGYTVATEEGKLDSGVSRAFVAC